MKAKDILTKNKDLDLRRYGKHEYSSKSGSGDSAYADFMAKDWVQVQMVTVEQYKERRASMEHVIAEENIPEGSTMVALCSMESMGGMIIPKSVHVFGLSETETAAYKYNNLNLSDSDIPRNAVLTVKKSQEEYTKDGETRKRDVYELLNEDETEKPRIIWYGLETNLDYTDENIFYVGCWRVDSFAFNGRPYIFDQLTEDRIFSEEDTTFYVNDMSPVEKTTFDREGVSEAVLKKVENVYKISSGNLYLARIVLNNSSILIPCSIQGIS